MKTIKYITLKSKTDKNKKILHELIKYTDLLFFIEILVIYKNILIKKIYIKVIN